MNGRTEQLKNSAYREEITNGVQVLTLAQEALKEAGVEAEICEVKDISKIADYGVMMTPALVVNGEVKVTGKIPSADEIKNWINQPES